MSIIHVLKGSNGWSFCRRSCVNVASIVDMRIKPRLFKITDVDLEYTLHIQYHPSNFPYPYIITKRYQNIWSVEREVTEIKRKLELFNKFKSLSVKS